MYKPACAKFRTPIIEKMSVNPDESRKSRSPKLRALSEVIISVLTTNSPPSAGAPWFTFYSQCSGWSFHLAYCWLCRIRSFNLAVNLKAYNLCIFGVVTHVGRASIRCCFLERSQEHWNLDLMILFTHQSRPCIGVERHIFQRQRDLG